MNGYHLILKIRNIEDTCSKLGLKFCSPRYGHRSTDSVSLVPKDSESFPIYSRDTELFCGTIEEVEVWLKGFLYARNYDRLLFGSKPCDNDQRRERRENLVRQNNLVKILSKTNSN